MEILGISESTSTSGCSAMKGKTLESILQFGTTHDVVKVPLELVNPIAISAFDYCRLLTG